MGDMDVTTKPLAVEARIIPRKAWLSNTFDTANRLP